MGKKRITAIGEAIEKKEKRTPQAEEKIHIPGMKGGQRIAEVEAEPVIEEVAEVQEKVEAVKKTAPKAPRIRGKKYQEAKQKIDITKLYSISDALILLKETSTTKFDSTAEVHFVVAKKGLKGEVELPHFQAKSKIVEIASDETIKKLEEGKINFDVLLTTPVMMPKLAKFAKLLGPKGLMPNPKTGTLTDNPEKAAKEFEKPTLSYRTEASAPLIHTVFGKVSQPETELKANFQVLVKVIGPQNIKSTTIKSTMGPGIKLQI